MVRLLCLHIVLLFCPPIERIHQAVVVQMPRLVVQPRPQMTQLVSHQVTSWPQDLIMELNKVDNMACIQSIVPSSEHEMDVCLCWYILEVQHHHQWQRSKCHNPVQYLQQLVRSLWTLLLWCQFLPRASHTKVDDLMSRF